jgi:hypothetical protein
MTIYLMTISFDDSSAKFVLTPLRAAFADSRSINENYNDISISP